MAEFKIPNNLEELNSNFEQKKPLMNQTSAYLESSRCLFCFDAPCIKACPTSIDIPLFIRQIYSGNIDGAAYTIYNSNYFGNICGKVCPTEVLCEGACVYNQQNSKPIEIGRLQSFATTNLQDSGKQIFTAAPLNGKKIAVIGAGHAGISAACELSRLGYKVDVYEKKDLPSGLAIYGVAPYKITNEEILNEVSYLQKQLGFNVIYNHAIESEEQFSKLEEDYNAVFLGIGLGNTRPLNIPGEDLKNCFGATEFIEDLKLNPLGTFIGKKVVIIGGGNTAMDAASEVARMGAEHVYLVYRKDKSSMSAYEFEYDLAKEVGVKGVFNASPKAILGDDKVTAVTFLTGDGDEIRFECDMVIKATGQLKQTQFLNKIKGLTYDSGGRIIVNEDFQTENSFYFASGDAVNGGAEVVNAVGEAKKAAIAIHNFLSK